MKTGGGVTISAISCQCEKKSVFFSPWPHISTVMRQLLVSHSLCIPLSLWAGKGNQLSHNCRAMVKEGGAKQGAMGWSKNELHRDDTSKEAELEET